MAPRKRKQPMRACRKAPPVYFEVESDSADEEIKTALVKKKRRVIQAVVPLPERVTLLPVQTILPQTLFGKKPEVHMKVLKRLCRELHPDLVEAILGHLPVSTLWSTVMAINPTRWSQILSNNGNTNILGHGNHVDSSIGYVKTFTCSVLGRCFVPPQHDLNRHAPPPRALEHTTNTWKVLPRYPKTTMSHELKVQSVSEGLILMVMLDPHGSRNFPATPGDDYCFRMVIWNPVSHSRRWLPRSPLSSFEEPNLHHYMEVLVVNPEKTGYRVVEFFDPVGTAQPVNLLLLARRRRKRFPREYRPKLKRISGYTVYDSSSATWSAVQRPPRNFSAQLHLNHANSFVSCDEGSVCFVNVDQLQFPEWEVPVGIVCWNSTTNVWSQALFPVNFFKLPRGPARGCYVKALLYADGKVYIIFDCGPLMPVYTHYIVSISLSDILSDIQSGIASFQHVGRVDGVAKSSKLPGGSQSAPKRNQMSPVDVECMQRKCGRRCIDHWYMLPVGRSFHLCVVVCGRWLKRFDLDSRMWYESMVEIPSDQNQNLSTMTVRALLPSGVAHFMNINYHPYIPSWVKV